MKRPIKKIEREPMVVVQLHVPKNLAHEARDISRRSQVSRAQVMRGWLQLGHKQAMDRLTVPG